MLNNQYTQNVSMFSCICPILAYLLAQYSPLAHIVNNTPVLFGCGKPFGIARADIEIYRTEIVIFLMSCNKQAITQDIPQVITQLSHSTVPNDMTYLSQTLCITPQYCSGTANHSVSPGPILILTEQKLLFS